MEQENTETIKVIGAGFGRTGTASLKIALERLGFGPCYHMVEVIKNGYVGNWEKVADEQGKNYDWDKVYRPKPGVVYQSAVDFPAAAYYKDMLRQYPHAKVILTVRDSAQQWHESAKETIASDFLHTKTFPNVVATTVLASNFARFDKMADRAVWEPVFGSKENLRKNGPQIYTDWVEEVKRTVPPDQLLVMNVKEGWEPLCRFLGVPVPPEPFPRVNDRQAFQNTIRNLGYAIFAGLVTISAASVGAGLYLWRHWG